MRKIGVIANPQSWYNKYKLNALSKIVRQYPDILYQEIKEFDHLITLLNNCADHKVDLLVISGGDGTVQAILTLILNGQTNYKTPPLLAILPGGRTNLIALEIGLKGRLEKIFRTLSSEVNGAKNIITKPILSVSVHPDHKPLFGLFLGMGAFTELTLMGRNKFHRWGLAKSLAILVTMIYFFIKLIFMPRSKSQDDVLRKYKIDFKANNNEFNTNPKFIFFVTTLNQLVYKMNPFWGQEKGFLRYLSIPYPPLNLLNSLWVVLRKKDKTQLEQLGYISNCATILECEIDNDFIIDGEIIKSFPNYPVKIKADHQLKFVCF
ncbi:MAG: hypothetical protein K1X44_03975 [Alphaproteobacteria bacterium]|nr:hypothetical protein [Alphaproteobacteria bacterium]